MLAFQYSLYFQGYCVSPCRLSVKSLSLCLLSLLTSLPGAFNYRAIIVTGPERVMDGPGDTEKALSATSGGSTADTVLAVCICVEID